MIEIYIYPKNKSKWKEKKYKSERKNICHRMEHTKLHRDKGAYEVIFKKEKHQWFILLRYDMHICFHLAFSGFGALNCTHIYRKCEPINAWIKFYIYSVAGVVLYLEIVFKAYWALEFPGRCCRTALWFSPKPEGVASVGVLVFPRHHWVPAMCKICLRFVCNPTVFTRISIHRI